jgi:hypothetical protein
MNSGKKSYKQQRNWLWLEDKNEMLPPMGKEGLSESVYATSGTSWKKHAL